MPLMVHKKLKLMNEVRIDANTVNIKVEIISEPGFNAQTQLDISSLRYGASEEVNFRRGSIVIGSKNDGNDLIVEFDGKGNDITNNNFAGKILGKTNSGDLIIGFTKLVAE
jgi:hypothetical protein